MSSLFLTRLFRLLVLLLSQILVFNQIHLLGYITPLVIGYMMVCLHRGSSRTGTLLWGFAIGVLFDVASNTAGMASASCTLAAMVQPVLLGAFAPRDAAEDFTPSMQTMGFWSYCLYVLALMGVLHASFYMLDAFTLVDWPLTLLSIGGGTLLTTVLIVFIELLVRHQK